MSDELINQRIRELDATTEGESVEPYIPVPIALQEAEELYDWCRFLSGPLNFGSGRVRFLSEQVKSEAGQLNFVSGRVRSHSGRVKT